MVQCSEDRTSTPPPYSIPSCTSPDPPSPTPPPQTKQPDRFSDPEPARGLDLRSAGVTSAPPTPDIRDEETLFAACTEEVYLGPPLCYSLLPSKKPRPFLLRSSSSDGLGGPCWSEVDPFQDHLCFPGSGPDSRPSCPPGALGVELRPLCQAPAGSEAPPYLNPEPVALIHSAAECSHTQTPGSNMAAVMTQISVCSAATNPSKEPGAAAATRINPKINCSAMRGADREEPEQRVEVDTRQEAQEEEEEEEGGDGRSRSQQDPKATTEEQVSVACIYLMSYLRHYTEP